MKKTILIFLWIGFGLEIYSMENGPMNAAWFYGEGPYAKANKYVQDRQWYEAELEYIKLLKDETGNDYDKNMARLNLASCRLAQRMTSNHWTAFDKLCGIKEERQLKKDITLQEKGTRCIVLTDKIGIGDIVHFLGAVGKLKKIAKELDVVVAVRKFMHKALEGPAKEYNVTLIDEKDVPTIEGKETHLISLLGHLYVWPHELEPEKVLYTTSEHALYSVKELLDSVKKDSKKICPVFLGENRQAVLMGGKQLPRDTKKHGRNLDVEEAFKQLLDQNKSIILLDCNPGKSRIKFIKKDEPYLAMATPYENRVKQLPDEENAFDTTIALGLLANTEEYKCVGFGADNGPVNVFTRVLSKEAQNRFAFIIPNGEEYDVRMEGDGKKYKQMLSSCWVYKCDGDQGEVICTAYKDMIQK